MCSFNGGDLEVRVQRLGEAAIIADYKSICTSTAIETQNPVGVRLSHPYFRLYINLQSG